MKKKSIIAPKKNTPKWKCGALVCTTGAQAPVPLPTAAAAHPPPIQQGQCGAHPRPHQPTRVRGNQRLLTVCLRRPDNTSRLLATSGEGQGADCSAPPTSTCLTGESAAAKDAREAEAQNSLLPRPLPGDCGVRQDRISPSRERAQPFRNACGIIAVCMLLGASLLKERKLLMHHWAGFRVVL
ncbi:hypothetical protein NDU88_002315 [Pleurodeles waltl]|uniref:Uncharacterized protein n=1 Tax=Pleurodeles waltl TaxID=8319 RepID=A0AAV7RF88_PLEWA|nr:hypothetical protein NDU88_002315 [Pleurodeles waltl]